VQAFLFWREGVLRHRLVRGRGAGQCERVQEAALDSQGAPCIPIGSVQAYLFWREGVLRHRLLRGRGTGQCERVLEAALDSQGAPCIPIGSVQAYLFWREGVCLATDACAHTHAGYLSHYTGNIRVEAT
jgi:hypothetical protein